MSRMLKKSASIVLASFRSSTYPEGKRACLGRQGWAGKKVTPHLKTRPAHRLAGVRKRDAHYSSRRGPHCGLADGHFEHLASKILVTGEPSECQPILGAYSIDCAAPFG